VLSQAPFKGRTSVVAIARGNQRAELRKQMGQTVHASILTPIVRVEALATALRSVLRPDVIPASSRASKPREVTPAPVVASAAPSRYRVLLADDNAVNQKLAVKMLEKLGCVVDVACNGSEAVTLSQQLPYDIIFMDCHMPEMDGFEATAEIRRLSASGRRIPIVAVTADALQGDRERCLEAGMDGYISKPIKREQVGT
jgi:CheY-like chemotaxis protein